MSSEEISRQIGVAVVAYSEAKKKLAHSETLLHLAGDGYKKAAEALAVLHGRVSTQLSDLISPDTVILPRERLGELLEENSQIRAEVVQSREQLLKFGVNVE